MNFLNKPSKLIEHDPRVAVNIDSLVQFKNQLSVPRLLDLVFSKKQRAGRYRSSQRGRGLSFEELRDYRAGDDIRSVDWKVSNRMRKPHVRLYSEDRDAQLLLLLDQRSSMFFGSQYKTKSVIAAELAATVLWQSLAAQDRCETIVFNDEQIQSLGNARSSNKLMQVLYGITNFNRALPMQTAHGHFAALHDVITKAEQICERSGTANQVFLISDMQGFDDHALKRIQRLGNRNELTIAKISDPLEMRLADWPQQVFGNGEQQFEISTSNQTLQERFSQEAHREGEKLTQLMMQLRRPVIEFDTLSDINKQLSGKA